MNVTVFDDFCDGTAPAFSTLFAETVTYTPKVGDATTVEALVDRGDNLQERTEHGDYLIKEAVVTIATSSISEPDVDGDSITFDSLTWGISGYAVSSGWYVVRVERRELIAKRARQ